MSQRQVIGFDRELRLEWLDAVASRAAAGDTAGDSRRWLDDYLADQVGGTGNGGNRGKTVTVLTRIWVNVPPRCMPLRDRATAALSIVEPGERLALHWAMASCVYPFFADVTAVVGRLLTLQGEVDRQAVIRRIADSWGDRPAVSRGCRAVWTSVVAWGALLETDKRGRYMPRRSPVQVRTDVWSLLRDAVPGTAQPSLFPFALDRL